MYGNVTTIYRSSKHENETQLTSPFLLFITCASIAIRGCYKAISASFDFTAFLCWVTCEAILIVYKKIQILIQ